jgi:hypothetical protein
VCKEVTVKRVFWMLMLVGLVAWMESVALGHGPHGPFGHHGCGWYGPPPVYSAGVVVARPVYAAPAPVLVAPPVVHQYYYYAPPAGSIHYFGRHFGFSLGF